MKERLKPDRCEMVGITTDSTPPYNSDWLMFYPGKNPGMVQVSDKSIDEVTLVLPDLSSPEVIEKQLMERDYDEIKGYLVEQTVEDSI